MEKYRESLERAKARLKTAEHMAFISYPMLNEKRLLLKILEELGTSLVYLINCVLQYEYTQHKTVLSNNAQENFQIFKKVSSSYGIDEEQLKKIIEILNLAEQHKRSPFEFVKNETIIIMSEELKTEAVTIARIKSFLTIIRTIISEISSRINK